MSCQIQNVTSDTPVMLEWDGGMAFLTPGGQTVVPCDAKLRRGVLNAELVTPPATFSGSVFTMKGQSFATAEDVVPVTGTYVLVRAARELPYVSAFDFTRAGASVSATPPSPTCKVFPSVEIAESQHKLITVSIVAAALLILFITFFVLYFVKK